MARPADAIIDDHLRRLSEGDRTAFDRVYAEARPLLQRFTAREVLGALRPEDAEAIAASVERGAASRFGLPPATFRKRLQRALERARLLWRTRHGHD